MTTAHGQPVRVHRGDESDVDDASSVLAAALADYPWTELTVASDRRDERLRALYHLVLGELVVPYGRLWVARAADGRVVGAAGWLTPRSEPTAPVLAHVESEVRRLRGGRAAVAVRAEQAVAAVAAQSWRDVPHWFLGALGVLATTRGHGVGTALLGAGLEAADADGAIARLETSLDRNVRLYERVGFTVCAQISLPGDVPCWLMQREQRHGSTLPVSRG